VVKAGKARGKQRCYVGAVAYQFYAFRAAVGDHCGKNRWPFFSTVTASHERLGADVRVWASTILKWIRRYGR